MSYAELDYIRLKTWKFFFHLADLNVFCVRHACDITILSQCLKKHVKDIQRWLINFLKLRGLTTKNTLVFQGKLLKPGSFLKFFSFKLIYSNLKKFNCSKNKYIRFKWTSSATRLQVVSSRRLCRSLHVRIRNRGIRNFRDKLKVLFSKKNSCLAVGQIIGYLNMILTNLFKQHDIRFTIMIQLFSLSNLLHKLFYKYLLRKYSSLPKIYSHINPQFKNQGRFNIKNQFLFRITSINSLNSASLYSVKNAKVV